MEEFKVKSSIIESVSYYDRNMFVKLKTKELLAYNSVPKNVFEKFLNTDSHDDFYKKKIISAFPSRRMA